MSSLIRSIVISFLCALFPFHLSYAVGKTIVIGEILKKSNPWRNQIVMQQYSVAAAKALQDHQRRYPKSSIAIETSFDENEFSGFSVAEKKESIAVLGYLYSSDALEASSIANKIKIPYVSPVSPLDALKTKYSLSLAISQGGLTKIFEKIKVRFDFPSFIVVPETALTSFGYGSVFSRSFANATSLHGKSDHLTAQLSKNLETLEDKKFNILLAG